jgi:hypothetical protein
MRKGLFYKIITLLLCLGWSAGSIGTATVEAGVSSRQNLPPRFDPAPECYVSKTDSDQPQLSGSMNHTVQGGASLQGDTFTTCWVSERNALEVVVHAVDPEGDHLSLSVLNAPLTALFSDSGNGEATFVWVPEFVGPFSSAGSPFELFFIASDGKLSSMLKVVINVINVNQNPELVLPESSEVAVGNELVFQVRGNDLDSDKVMVQASNLPPKASFDEGSGIFRWTPQLADTGLWSISFQATDTLGGFCSRETYVKVVPPSTFSLSLGVVESILGSVVNVPVNLVNSDPVAGMELQVEFDPDLFTFLGVLRQGCRTENWEYFTWKEKTNGFHQVVKIVGVADFPNQVPVPALLPGSGVLVHLSFGVATDPYLNGFLLPLEFFSFDFTDNTLSSPRGRFISRGDIDLTGGGVWLNPAQTLVGDVNQNGLPFEISDAVKLAAYLSGRTTLSQQQLINSDVNRDGSMATLADLVFLIRHILEQEHVPNGEIVTPTMAKAVVKVSEEPSGSLGAKSLTSIRVESEASIGGAMMIFKGENVKIENLKLSPESQGLDLYTSQVGDQFRVLVISQKAKPLPKGDSPLFTFEGEGLDTIQIFLSDQQGELLKVEQQYEHNSLPTKYTLYQNYPNPFNPETHIKYSVGTDASVHVSLKVYNVAGQLVKTLVDEDKLPGEYNQTWNGKNENNENVASGVYFYKLKVSNYVETKKMVLLR